MFLTTKHNSLIGTELCYLILINQNFQINEHLGDVVDREATQPHGVVSLYIFFFL